MKGDSNKGDEITTVKAILNQIYIEILRETEMCASIIKVCHYRDLWVDELSVNEQKQVL